MYLYLRYIGKLSYPALQICWQIQFYLLLTFLLLHFAIYHLTFNFVTITTIPKLPLQPIILSYFKVHLSTHIDALVLKGQHAKFSPSSSTAFAWEMRYVRNLGARCPKHLGSGCPTSLGGVGLSLNFFIWSWYVTMPNLLARRYEKFWGTGALRIGEPRTQMAPKTLPYIWRVIVLNFVALLKCHQGQSKIMPLWGTPSQRSWAQNLIVFFRANINLPWKFHKNPPTTFWVILYTNKEILQKWTTKQQPDDIILQLRRGL